MEDFKNQLLSISKDEYSDEQLVSFFELIAEKFKVGSSTLVCEKLKHSFF